MTAEPLQFLLLLMAGWVNRRQLLVIDYLKEENRVLREQLDGGRLRFTDDQRRRLATKGRALGRRVLDELAGLVTPETILRWYRELVAKKYDGSARRGTGRPAGPSSVRQLVVTFAKENPGWGYTRLLGALRNVGHELGRNTIKRILQEHGLEPAPARGKRMPWSTFIKSHLGAIAATDFFSVEVLTFTGLVRYFVLFVIDLETRRVQIAGIVRQPHGTWMQQIARNLTDDVDGFLKGMRYLIHDRDPLFTDAFREVLRGARVECLKLPAHSPNLNAFAERFVLSIKSECLNKLVLLGEWHLRHAVTEFVEHYYDERNHQGLENQLLTPTALPANDNEPIVRRQRLGGLLNFYFRPARSGAPGSVRAVAAAPAGAPEEPCTRRSTCAACPINRDDGRSPRTPCAARSQTDQRDRLLAQDGTPVDAAHAEARGGQTLLGAAAEALGVGPHRRPVEEVQRAARAQRGKHAGQFDPRLVGEQAHVDGEGEVEAIAELDAGQRCAGRPVRRGWPQHWPCTPRRSWSASDRRRARGRCSAVRPARPGRCRGRSRALDAPSGCKGRSGKAQTKRGAITAARAQDMRA